MSAAHAPLLERRGRPEGTRPAYGNALLELGEERDDIVVLTADLGRIITVDRFGERWPERYVNTGVAEQNMAGIAAGLAATGFVPFVSTFAVFASMRMCEQVRTSICYPRLNVKIVPSHGGITIGENGVTHQALEDIAIMRSLPNMTVIVPADAFEVCQAVRAAAAWDGPVYLRLGRPRVPGLFSNDHRFEIGSVYLCRRGRDVTIVSTGLMLAHALDAARDLAAEGIEAEVLHAPTLKPLDAPSICESAARTGSVVTAEEHSIMGGLGGAVAEILAEHHPTPLRRVGVRDTFAESGKPAELMEKYGLTSRHIAEACRALL
jgi:transketolase